MAAEVSAYDWMEEFIGATESEVINDREKFIDESGNLKGKNGKLWPMGVFERPSVAELRSQLTELPQSRTSELPCPLVVKDGIDIGDYQAQFKTDDKAMVQLASNMHCLENGSPSTSADCGRLVSGYASDCTQGPAAAFGVPAASLVRAHYAFKADGKPSSEWGQTSDRQVNLIEDVCQAKYCGDCENGKARLLGKEIPVTPEIIDDVAGLTKVGLHRDAQVVFRRGSRRHTISVIEDPQFVDQVCSATLCIGYANAICNPSKDRLNNLCSSLLRAAYEGAYLAAIARQRKILLLTLIGGASFRNPHNLILAELKRAHDLYATHPASQLEEVQLLLYEPGTAKRYQEELQRL